MHANNYSLNSNFDLLTISFSLRGQPNLCKYTHKLFVCSVRCASAWCQESWLMLLATKNTIVHIVIIYSQILKCSISIKLARAAKTLSLSFPLWWCKSRRIVAVGDSNCVKYAKNILIKWCCVAVRSTRCAPWNCGKCVHHRKVETMAFSFPSVAIKI